MRIFEQIMGYFKSLQWVTVVTAVVIVAAVIVFFVLSTIKSEAQMSVSGVGMSLTVFIAAAIIAVLQIIQLSTLNKKLQGYVYDCVDKGILGKEISNKR